MKKLYTVLIISLFSTAIFAQSFIEVTGTPFEAAYDGSISFGDIDNDNDLDVLIGATLFTNDGYGLFETTWTISYGFSSTSSAFTDIDNDTDKDFFFSWVEQDGGWEPNWLHFESRLFSNNGSGSFTANNSFQAIGFGSTAFADVDNDDDQDLLITGYTWYQGGLWGGPQDPETILYLNDGNGIFTEVTETPFEGVGGSANCHITFADVDNDNDQDVFIIGLNEEWGPSAKLYNNDGNGNFTEVVENPFDGDYIGSVAFSDIDNDTDLDMLSTGGSVLGEAIAKLYTNDGNGNFTEVINTPFEGVEYGSVAFSDVDNDNDKDVLITGVDSSGQKIAKLYLNDEGGKFSEVEGTPFEGVYNSSISFADIDNDNDQDVLISGLNGSGDATVKLYKNLTISTIINIPADHPTIQDGIDAANEGDTVLVQPGTYVENINITGKNITLASLMLTTQDTSYISQTIIDGDQGGTVVWFEDVDTTAMLCGFTITNGSGGGITIDSGSPELTWLDVNSNSEIFYWWNAMGQGGGISCYGGLILRHSKVRNNQSVEGGGIYFYPTPSGGIYCEDVEISNNSAQAGGGIAIQDTLETFFLKDVIIKNNSASSMGSYAGQGGGGIYIERPIIGSVWKNVSIINNTAAEGGGMFLASEFHPEVMKNVYFDENFASQGGGGIYVDEGAYLYISPECSANSCSSFDNISISGNSTNGHGGGIYCKGDMAIFGNDSLDANIRISENISQGYGGGIYGKNYDYEVKIMLRSLRIQDNESRLNGGGLFLFESEVNLINILITGNSSSLQNGGGIYNDKSHGSIVNSTFTDNTTDDNGGAIYSELDQINNLNIQNCILWNDQPDEIFNKNISYKASVEYSIVQGDYEGQGNMDEDPMFEGDADNPYQLSSASPGIDVGSADTTGLNLPYSDLLGNLRIWDGNNDGMATIDMGAYEFGLTAVNVYETFQNSSDNQNGLKIYPNPFSQSAIIAFEFKESRSVDLSVYNHLGVKTTSLFVGEKNKGIHQLTWDSKSLPSGIYFVRLQTEVGISTQKIIKR